MTLLLDTHAWIWWLEGSLRLPDKLVATISDSANLVFVSAATVWEIAIKQASGKLELEPVDLVREITEGGFQELPITAQHAANAGALPRHHDDPFDRMLIAQAKLENLTLISRDSAMSAYNVELLWS